MSDNNVLIVDDEKSILTAMQRTLTDDFTVFTAQTSIEAMMVLEQNNIEVVIADYMLANSNGAELLQMIHHRWPHITRIVLSGYNMLEIAKDAINKAGAYRFITKPWDDDELKLILLSACKRSKMVLQNISLIKDIDEKNAKIESATKVIERKLKLKEKQLLKSRESILAYQHQINAINELITKISAGKSFKELIIAILDGLRNVINCNSSCIVSIADSGREFNLYSQGRNETLNIDDYPDFVSVLDTMHRNNYIPLILSSIYATESNRRLLFSDDRIYSILLYPIHIKTTSDKSYNFIIGLGRLGRNIFDKKDVTRLKDISGSTYVALERLITSNYIQFGLKQWEETFNSIKDPLFIVSPDYVIVRANNAVESLSKEKVSYIIGKKCYEVFRNSDKVCDGCLVNKVFNSGTPDYMEGVPCFDNPKVVASAYPVFDKDNRLSSVIQYNNDRTAEFKLYKQLIQSEKLAAIGMLAANIAHEINNPLGGILAYAQLLKRDTQEGTSLYNDLLEIESACHRCKLIISNLLDFSRDTSEEGKAVVAVKKVIEDTLPLLNVCLKGHNFIIDIENKALSVLGNMGQLQQVFFNLITNASHATKKGDEIRFKAVKEKDNKVKIIISDKGSGIPANVLPHIFESFFTTKEQGVGTGLGLFVTHGIITEHDGSIEVESQVGKGTSFIIELPAGEVR